MSVITLDSKCLTNISKAYLVIFVAKKSCTSKLIFLTKLSNSSIIPIVASYFLLSFLDRSNLGRWILSGCLQKSLHMNDRQFSLAITLTFVPYIAVELPANLLLKKIGPKIFLPTIIIIWGLVTMLQGFVKSFNGLICARIFLGLAEGGMMPGIVLYLSYFYTRSELQWRIALFFASASLSGAFSGLLAYYLVKLDGKCGLDGWAWIFIVEGLFTCCWGIFSYFVFLDSIEESIFLTDNEKKILIKRLQSDRAKDSLDESFSWAEVTRSLASPHVLMVVLVFFLSGTSTFSMAYFQPTIIKSFGYSNSLTQLLSVPPYAVAFTWTLISSYISDKHGLRGSTVCFCALIGLVGYILFFFAETSQKSLKYTSLFLSITGVQSCAPPLLAWISNNSAGSYRRATSIALGCVAANLGGICGTWIFPNSESPKYCTGTIINLAFSCGSIIITFINLVYLKKSNEHKIKNSEEILLKYKSHDNSMDFKQSSLEAWKELGDKHPDFTYVY
ncbi:major facilitator superfamily domain-containing protein [Phakopsora pachyrhizi]|uniref:Major facilitator superfamily domain-containing protein n=1 Tax=Phakopsora pachyrhizi TaxID=170000 RepID=A0AAV0BH48_PHAPC|nr:major facilitator superfamily domain-containing protein [Phakopsora pachyrhizi]CAH7686056.1 major facilitator superfamily domain-containing protein [Phakopsora pachyrhizi]